MHHHEKAKKSASTDAGSCLVSIADADLDAGSCLVSIADADLNQYFKGLLINSKYFIVYLQKITVQYHLSSHELAHAPP